MDLHQKVRKDLPGGVHDSEFTSFGSAAVPPWWGVNVSENVILKFSSVLEDIQESATKTKQQLSPKNPRTLQPELLLKTEEPLIIF